MPASRQDRRDISALYEPGVSNESLYEWKKPPTPVMPSYSNPFSSIGSGSGTANVGRSRTNGPQGAATRMGMNARRQDILCSNVTKSRTVASPSENRAPKRPRTEGGGPSQSAWNLPTPTIDLSRDDGDASDAQHPIKASIASSSRLSPPAGKPPQLTLVEDGPNMQALGQRSWLPEDPIEDSSSPLKASEPQPSLTVRSRIAEIEKRSVGHDPPPPKEDLRARMKQKPPSRSFGPATIFTLPTSNDAKIKNKKRKRKESFLPLAKYYLEPDIPHSEGQVKWDKRGLSIQTDDQPEVLITCGRGFDQLLFTPASSQDTRLLIQIRRDTGDPLRVVLMFHNNHTDWDSHLYEKLIDWLKMHCSSFARTGHSIIDSIWKEVDNDVEQRRKYMQTKTQPKADSYGFETMSDDGSGGPANQSRAATMSASGSRSTSSAPAKPFPRQAGPSRPLLGNPHPNFVPTERSMQEGSSSKAIPNTASSSSAIADEPTPLRRSTRQSAGGPPKPPLDADEVILVYPLGVPGKVNITNGDVARLEPGEFLNDTLIEFGLKLWLKELEEANPDLAKQVHVFSSFFYKKLNKRNIEEGYNSVRKWTAKIDLFEKKYIIVPINENVHWYLALIYEPEHVISSPSPPSPIPHSEGEQTKPSASGDETIANNLVDMEDIETDDPRHMTSSEQGVEDHLTSLTQACSIDVGAEQPEKVEDVMNIDLEQHENTRPATPGIMTERDALVDLTTLPMRYTPEVACYSKVESKPSSASSANGDDADILNIVGKDFLPATPDKDRDAGIPPVALYGKGTRSGKTYGEYAALGSTPRIRRSLAKSSGLPANGFYLHNQTYIFTLDSLGSKQTRAGNQLTKYLRFEAKDKKGVDSRAKVEVKQVHVPTQPNFADCGIYLLHLAQTFISKPKFYLNKVFTTSNETPVSIRQKCWNDSEVSGMREGLKTRIYELSKEWKQTQKPISKERDQASPPANEPSSDSDIDIIEAIAAPSTRGKGKGPRKQTAAARLR